MGLISTQRMTCDWEMCCSGCSRLRGETNEGAALLPLALPKWREEFEEGPGLSDGCSTSLAQGKEELEGGIMSPFCPISQEGLIKYKLPMLEKRTGSKLTLFILVLQRNMLLFLPSLKSTY